MRHLSTADTATVSRYRMADSLLFAAHATCAIAAFALGLVTAWPSRRKRQLARVVRSQCQGRFGVMWMNKRATRRQYSKGPQVARLPVA
jgi:hypothetical protein